ncbi:MAG: MYG1 family protein [Mobilitalea sp.]
MIIIMNIDKITMEQIENMDSAFTHGGTFHSDDVFSAALLKIINPDIEIIRGFKVPDNFTGLVFDIGGGTYDHHQADNEVRENGIPYAAFGKLWRDLGPELVGEKEAEKIDHSIVQPLDKTDNTGERNPLSSMISSYNPTWDDESNTDENFNKAVNSALEYIQNKIRSCKSKDRARKIVEEALLSIDDVGIVILPRFAPWSDTLIPSEAKLVIFPSQRGGFNLQVISKNFKNREPKVNLPERWAGQPEEVLRNEMPGLNFCHSNRFLAAFDNLESAKLGAEIAISEAKEQAATQVKHKNHNPLILSIKKLVSKILH